MSRPDAEHGPYPINITPGGVQNAEEKHTEWGPYQHGSIFNVDSPEDFPEFLMDIVRAAEEVPPERQPSRGTWSRVVERPGEMPVGWDENDLPEHVYTVITMPSGGDADRHNLVDAFPGEP